MSRLAELIEKNKQELMNDPELIAKIEEKVEERIINQLKND